MNANDKILSLINRCDIAMFGNNDEKGNPQIKAMCKTRQEGISKFWFCSNTSSKRAAQIKNDNRGCLYFYENFEGVLLRGTVEVSLDDDLRKSLWEDGMEMHYPLGALDPDFTVIIFTVESGNYYGGLPTVEFEIDNDKYREI